VNLPAQCFGLLYTLCSTSSVSLNPPADRGGSGIAFPCLAVLVELLYLGDVARPLRRAGHIFLDHRPHAVRGASMSTSSRSLVTLRLSNCAGRSAPSHRGCWGASASQLPLYLIGQIISTIGTWMQSVALPWLALELTHSGLLVGLVLAAQFTPVLLGSQFGAWSRTATGSARFSCHQSLFTLRHSLCSRCPPPATRATGWCWSRAGDRHDQPFRCPARQSFVIEMVGAGLMNAIALNSSVFNAARSSVRDCRRADRTVGVPLCFLANSLSYLAAVAASC